MIEVFFLILVCVLGFGLGVFLALAVPACAAGELDLDVRAQHYEINLARSNLAARIGTLESWLAMLQRDLERAARRRGFVLTWEGETSRPALPYLPERRD